MVENIVWCHGETTDLESDSSVYSILYLSPNSLFGLSFNLNSFRISFSLRSHPGLSNSAGVFSTYGI